jgi:hypothetical protein
MQYALLFYNPPQSQIPESQRERVLGDMLEKMGAWIGEMQSAGVFRSSLRLAPVDSATSLRKQGGDVLFTDGPFAETKEILGGFVLVECKNLDEALAWARRCPLLAIGTVEVRPEWGPASAGA